MYMYGGNKDGFSYGFINCGVICGGGYGKSYFILHFRFISPINLRLVIEYNSLAVSGGMFWLVGLYF